MSRDVRRMKATLEFDLTDGGDEHDYKTMYYAHEAVQALIAMQTYLRSQWKHRDMDGVSADDLLDEIWKEFNDICGFILEATT